MEEYEHGCPYCIYEAKSAKGLSDHIRENHPHHIPKHSTLTEDVESAVEHHRKRGGY